MRFVDSHLHLDSPEAADALAFATATQTLLLACGVDRATSEGTVRTATERPGTVKSFVGVHPSEAGKTGDLGWLGNALRRATGVGEVGLDPTYSDAGPEGAQARVFGRMLEAAVSAGKPVQVHSRGAEGACLDAISEHGAKSVLLHWLENEEALPRAMGMGCRVSFGPALLYSRKLQRMAKSCDRSLVLVESDSPVAYAPLGGVRGPSTVPSVVFKLAELWGTSFEEARVISTENAMVFLGAGGKG